MHSHLTVSYDCGVVNMYLYFFSYKTEFFSIQSNAKNLFSSIKMDLDLWDCLGKVKLILKHYFIGLI